ncbi:MAG: sigma-70 family RNA polymerase sigma factor [Bacteroidota bacterium]|nr:sigma-70 family RNA polymerase sigma factor [Bacteroidota bacterium]MDP4233997.1 sigma-70 family RNA polymerase sigma factor [Bacteroidota bacterium]MDP4242864.1 sigma-70 family RNA polymerase sigma factor [Bacteroidota bacterium]MDP4287698.1 sigma-70 family RNA polymerase sigma factor [Bacteroidota bacterium]
MIQTESEKQERFMACLTPCLARLSRFCHALTKDGVDDRSSTENGRDLLSDAILLAYENFDTLRAPEAFTSYIFITARRLYYRRERRKKIWGVFGSDAEQIIDDRTTAPDVRLDLEALDRALAQLPEKQREAVILFEISELSLKEICKIQGGSLSGVKSRIVRGREKLAELLGERESRLPDGGATRRADITSFQRSGAIAFMREKV